MIEEFAIQTLLDSAGVSALVGTRVYPGVRPQSSALPSLVLNVISTVPSYSDDGEDNLEDTRIQIDSYGATYGGAKLLSRAVRAVLSAYDGSGYGVKVPYITVDNERDLNEDAVGEADAIFRTSTDYILTWAKL